MTLRFFPFPFLFGIFILCIVLVVLWGRKRSLSYLVCFSVFWVYLLLVASVTLFPMPLPAAGVGSQARLSAADILSTVVVMPFYYGEFKYESTTYIILREIVANIILTIPFGFGISFVAKIRPRRIFFLALAVGIGIETTQLILCLLLGTNYRGVDINDAMMNVLGVLVGYALFRGFSWLFVLVTQRFKLEPKGFLAYMLRVSQNSI